MTNFDWTSWITPSLAVLGFGLSLVNFVRTWNTVRIEKEEGVDDRCSLQVFNDSPHAITVVMIGPISGTGLVDTDLAHMKELCPRLRIEARDTVTIEVHQELAIQADTYELLHGRVGWWVKLSTQQIYFTHAWPVRLLWKIHNKVSGLDRIGADVLRQLRRENPYWHRRQQRSEEPETTRSDHEESKKQGGLH